MKRLALSTILMLAVCAANATYCPDGSLIESHPNHDCNYKPPTTPPVTPAPATATSKADAKAAADARAAAIAAQKQKQKQKQAQSTDVNATVTGGNTESSSRADSSSSNGLDNIGNSTDQSSSSFKAIAIALPTTSALPQLPLIEGCPQANVKQHDREIGFNFIRDAQSEVNTDRCAGIKWYNTFVQTCRFASAYQLSNLEVQSFQPKFAPPTPSAGKYQDLDISMQDCEVLRAPKPPAPPVTATNYIYVEKPCVPAPAPKSKTPPRKAAKKPTVDACGK